MALPGNEHLSGYDPIAFGSGRDGYAFTGQFLEVLNGQTKYGSAPVFVFAGGDEKRRILWGYHADLKRAWKEADPQGGSSVTITRSEQALPIEGTDKRQYAYTVTAELEQSEEPVSSQLGPDDPWPAEQF